MKNLTFLSAFILGLFSFSALQAQEKNIDLELQVVDNEEEVFVPFGDEYTVQLKLINHGPDVLEVGDSVWFQMVGGISLGIIDDIHIEVDESFTFPSLTAWASETQTENSTSEFCYEMLESNSYIDDNSSNNSSCITVTFEGNSVSVNEIAYDNTLKLYPNPVQNGILYFESPWTADHVQLIIRDITGREIIKKSQFLSEGQVQEINTSQFSNGVYLLELMKEGKSIIQQFVIGN